MKTHRIRRLTGYVVGILLLASCAQQSRYGMVVDPNTGLMIGSNVSRNMFLDSSQLGNKTIKVTVRNTSGDPNFDLYGFTEQLKRSYASKGFVPTDSDDFGMRLDVNVVANSQIQQSLASQYGLLGASAGGIGGQLIDGDGTGAGVGIVAGAALGSILGSYETDDTYIVVAQVRIGLTDRRVSRSEKTITFSRSGATEEERESDKVFAPFRYQSTNRVAVYAGGRNTPQSSIVSPVRQRMVRILGDII